MVSHATRPPAPPPSYSDIAAPSPYPPSAASVTQRAASVSSGRSHTRRHRHARTHHGGSSSHIAQNEFPVFSLTGDVEIIVSTANGRKEKRYVLHRLILSQCSGFFEAGTRAEWSNGGLATQTTNGGLPKINENERASLLGGSSASRASSRDRGVGGEGATGSGRRWRYVVDWEGCADGDAPMLTQREDAPASIFGGPSSSHQQQQQRSRPPASNETFFRSMSNFSALSVSDRSPTEAFAPGEEILKDYDNLFRTMYQFPPILDSINIATAYTECKALLHLADMYDALEIVGSRVDHHLLRFGARLFKQIAKYPPSYLKLGYLSRSQTIFTEALIHVVGQWPLGAPQLRGQIEANVMDLIEDKVDELREVEERVEFKLWRLTLTTSRGERVTPSNDYLTWLAISLFRQWLAENTTPLPTGILKDSSRSGSGISAPPAPSTNAPTRSASRSSSSAGGGNHHIASQRVNQPSAPLNGNPTSSSSSSSSNQPISTGRVYRTLGSTVQSSYLNHEELKRFLKLQPDLYHRDNLKRFERRMDELKNLARDAVAPLMRNFLELDLGAFGPVGLGYVTCTRLAEQELPWED